MMVIQYIISEKKASQSLAVGYSLLGFLIVVFASLIIHLLVRNIGQEEADDGELKGSSFSQQSHSDISVAAEVEMSENQSINQNRQSIISAAV
jgi:uncharacterized protein (UPF0333 family)